MTQEEKDILIKDLCVRLPYGVIVETPKGKGYVCDINLTIFGTEAGVNINATSRDKFNIEDIKPYLIPLSSMTEEQKKELFKYCEFYIQENGEGKNEEVYGIEIARRPDPAYCYDHTFRIWGIDMRAINWLLKNHFDIYGLIPMDLAIDATGLNIY